MIEDRGHMIKTSFIILVPGAPDRLNETLDSIAAQREEETQIICLLDGAYQDSTKKVIEQNYPSVIVLYSDLATEGIAEALNRGISLSEGNVVFLAAQLVILPPGLVSAYVKKLFSNESIGFVYGNFIEERGRNEEVLMYAKTDNYDYSEVSHIGPVRAVKKEVFEAVGHYDSRLKHAFDYDLRLRIFERFGIGLVKEPLYRVLYTGEAAGTNDPTRPSYSYIHYNEEEEGEYREACYRSLRRRSAFLTRDSVSLRCNHKITGDPQISVVIPLYNRVEYIGRTIESVLSSEWKGFEIIIVDNSSTDGSLGAAEEYLKLGNIILLKNEINNTAGALNLGIRHARGKYICQLDSDDLYTPDALGTMYSYMESNPGFALGVSYYDCIGPDDRLLPEFGVVKHLEYDRNNLIRTDGVGAARIWHRCVIEEMNGFDEINLGSYAEDYDLVLKVSEKYDILRIPYVLYRYRMNHKRTGEEAEYIIRHAKKTFARRSAIMRRRLINGASGEDGTP